MVFGPKGLLISQCLFTVSHGCHICPHLQVLTSAFMLSTSSPGITSSLLSIFPNPTTAFKIETNLSKKLWCSHFSIPHSSPFRLTMFNLSPVHVCLGLANSCIPIFIYVTTRWKVSLKSGSLLMLWFLLGAGKLRARGRCTWNTGRPVGFPITTFHVKKETLSDR